MSNTDRPIGKRYSQLYVDAGEPVYESRRLQHRAASYFRTNFEAAGEAVWNALQNEMGAQPPDRSGWDYENVEKFLASAQTPVFLDAVTVIGDALRGRDEAGSYDRRNSASKWRTFIARAFTEENSKFEIDEAGGVHPRIDPAFTVARTAAVQGLADRRYLDAREHFETAHAALDELPAATNRAIREVYMANEEIFKLVCPDATNLDPGEINKRLVPIVANLLQGPEKDAVNGMLRAASDYATASHQYRHAQGQPELPPASMETTTLMIGTGTALLRWLIWLDVKRRADPPAR